MWMHTVKTFCKKLVGGAAVMAGCVTAHAQPMPPSEPVVQATSGTDAPTTMPPSTNEPLSAQPPTQTSPSARSDVAEQQVQADLDGEYQEEFQSRKSPMSKVSQIFSLSWDMGLALGDFHDFVQNVSFAGVEFEGRWFVQRHFTLGFSFGWNRFSQSGPRETYELENGAVTATLYRYAEFISPKLTAHYYPILDAPVVPYLGVGAGPTYSGYQLTAADVSLSQSDWFFIASPEIGFLIPLKWGFGTAGIDVAVRYNWTSADLANSVSNAQYLAWSIGIFSTL
jgi:hypothetical protein